MAVVTRGSDLTGGNLIGLKIEISPEILLHRDAGIDSKIFTLIPPHIRTVRELKNHLSTNVLRTPSPFYFYNGEYRIPDEEDIRIFSLLTEACRILPVPRPRSVLSMSASLPGIISTPITSCNGAPTPKRVQFSDQLSSSSSPPREFETNGVSSSIISPVDLDEVDDANVTLDDSEERRTFLSLTAFSPAPASASRTDKKVEARVGDVDESQDSKESSKKKRRQRRRHKAKHQDKAAPDTISPGDSEGDKAKKMNRMKLRSSLALDSDRKKSVEGSPNSKKRKTQALQAYDADESELDPSQNQNASVALDLSEHSKLLYIPTISDTSRSPDTEVEQVKGEGEKVFLSPNTAFSGTTGYVRLRTSCTEGTISSFNSSGYGSPTATSTRRRQDTPNLPRILKNPGSAYEHVKKSLNARLDQAAEHNAEMLEYQPVEVGASMNGKNTLENGNGEVNLQRTEAFYLNLPSIKEVAEIDIGNVVAFKIVELDENYVPAVSSYKEACVTAKDGSLLTFEYLKNEVKERSGAFEIQDEEIETESLDHDSLKNFNELIEPKLLQVQV